MKIKKTLGIASIITFLIGVVTAGILYTKEKKEYARRVFY